MRGCRTSSESALEKGEFVYKERPWSPSKDGGVGIEMWVEWKEADEEQLVGTIMVNKEKGTAYMCFEEGAFVDVHILREMLAKVESLQK
jgi:hypothetical protein